MVRDDTIIVFQSTLSPNASEHSLSSQHKVNTIVVFTSIYVSLSWASESWSGRPIRSTKWHSHISLAMPWDSLLRASFASKLRRISYWRENHLLIKSIMSLMNCFWGFGWSRLGLLILHKYPFLGPDAFAGTWILHALITSDNCHFGVSFSHEHLITPSSHTWRIGILIKDLGTPFVHWWC
jgi:hypothetical protein